MSIEYVRPGDKISIEIRLGDNTVGKFVKAILKQQDQIVTSITLTDTGDGMYFDNSFTKPAGRITAIFEVYDDIGLTQKNDKFKDDESIISYEDPPLLNTINQVASLGPEIEAEVIDDESIDVIILSDMEIISIIQEEQDIDSLVESDPETFSLISDDEDIQALEES